MFLEINDISKIITVKQNIFTRYQYPLVYKFLYNLQNTLAKDLEAGFILTSLSIKALKIFNKTNNTQSYQEFLTNESIYIGKIKKADLARELEIPRETIRRKLNLLQEKDLINIKDNFFDVKIKAFEVADLNTILRNYSKGVKLIIDDMVDKNKISFNKDLGDEYLNEKFTTHWLYILNMFIEIGLVWKKKLKSIEGWLIFGTCALNQMYNLRDNRNYYKLHKDDTENYYLNMISKETSNGLNPTTIADLTGIPRQTVIRHLQTLVKIKALEKDKKNNLFHLPKAKEKKKTIIEGINRVNLYISIGIQKNLQLI